MSNTTYPNWLPPFKDDEKVMMILYSGGLDSTVMLADMLDQGWTVVPIVFNNESYSFQTQFKPAISASLATMGLLPYTIWSLSPNYIGLPYSKDDYAFFPGHKITFWNTAMSYAMRMNIWNIGAGYMDENEHGGFLDETDQFIDDVMDLYSRYYLNEPMNTIDVQGKKFIRHTPYRKMDKADIVEIGNRLGVPMELTRTCAKYGTINSVHCGSCEGCRRRKYGFVLAEVEDRTTYLDNSHPDDMVAKRDIYQKLTNKNKKKHNYTGRI